MVATLLPMFPNLDSAFPQINLDVVRQSFSALSYQLGAVATTFLLGLWVHGIGGSGGPRNGIGNIAVAVRAALLTALAFCLAGAVQTSQLESSWMVALGILLGLAEDEK
jgi:sulfite exporter TauE/SafE